MHRNALSALPRCSVLAPLKTSPFTILIFLQEIKLSNATRHLAAMCVHLIMSGGFFLSSFARWMRKSLDHRKTLLCLGRARRAEIKINFLLVPKNLTKEIISPCWRCSASRWSERNYLALFGGAVVDIGKRKIKGKNSFFPLHRFYQICADRFLVTDQHFTTQKVIKEMEIIAPATARSSFQFALFFIVVGHRKVFRRSSRGKRNEIMAVEMARIRVEVGSESIQISSVKLRRLCRAAFAPLFAGDSP